MKTVRPQALAKDVVIIDGLSRSGKTLLGPVLSSLDRAELWCLDYLFEYLCTLDALGRMDKDACSMMIRLYADIDLYHQSIGRNTNFRKEDDSGVYNNGLEKVYRQRAGGLAGDNTVREIRRKRPILFLMTHYLFGASDILFESLGGRLKQYVLMERHPFWLVESWYEGKWDLRIGRDPREFQICCRVGSRTVPWFARGWAREYVSLGRLEQAIRVIDYFEQSFDARCERLSSSERKKFLRVAFEDFAVRPDPILDHIQKALHTRLTARTKKIMKKMNVPRRLFKKDLTTQAARIGRLLRKESVRPKYRRILEGLCEKYRAKHPHLFRGRA
ncbi:MAG: hypothetical protein HYZ52_01180 [Candidatus Omnitrophica bacterium]|nr:hypothetical protein [Candidatus Omnitrophota bacterium]